VREEVSEYLKKKVAEMKRLGIKKVNSISKEGFAGDEIIALGQNTIDGVIAICARQRKRNRGAPC
jgi:hypothetical protein